MNPKVSSFSTKNGTLFSTNNSTPTKPSQARPSSPSQPPHSPLKPEQDVQASYPKKGHVSRLVKQFNALSASAQNTQPSSRLKPKTPPKSNKPIHAKSSPPILPALLAKSHPHNAQSPTNLVPDSGKIKQAPPAETPEQTSPPSILNKNNEPPETDLFELLEGFRTKALF